jgi:hypothetical protein
MGSAARFIAGWLLAAVMAVLAAGQGVSMVADRVTSDRPSPLTAQDVNRALARGERADDAATTTVASGSPSSSVSVDAKTGGQEVAGGSTTPTPTPTNPPGNAGESGESGGVGHSGGSGSSSGALSTPTTTTPPATENRTYALRGGTVTLRFSPSGVDVVVAQPAAGYSYSVESHHGDGLRVEFRSERSRSRVEAWWEGGPREQVSEN